MKHDYSFDGKQMLALGAAAVLVAAMLFLAGMFAGQKAGVNWLPGFSHAPAAAGKTAVHPALQTLAKGGTPALPAIPSGQKVVSALANPPRAAGSASAPANQGAANPLVNPAAANPAVATPVAAGPAPVSGASALMQTFKSDAAKAEEAAAQAPFCIQLGTFIDPKKAKMFQDEMKEHGYLTVVFKALDADQKLWYAVRINGFKDVSSAAQAAAEFTSKEQVQAIVRPADSL